MNKRKPTSNSQIPGASKTVKKLKSAEEVPGDGDDTGEIESDDEAGDSEHRQVEKRVIMTRQRKFLMEQRQNYQLFGCRPFVTVEPFQFVLNTNASLVSGQKTKLENPKKSPVSGLRPLTLLETEKMMMLMILEKRIKTPVPPPTFRDLPPEMKDKIASYLDDRNDLKNCCKASAQLDKVLILRKPVFLFKDILPHILTGGSSLNKKDVRNCRLVCKEWLESIDSFFENHPVTRPYNDDFCLQQMKCYGYGHRHYINYLMGPYSRLSTPVVTIALSIQNLDDFQQTYNRLYLSAPTRNPFLARSVQFVIDTTARAGIPAEWDLIGTTLDRTVDFLRDFGQHIWHLSIKIRGHIPLTFRVYSYLMDIFKCVPNLRTFSLSSPPVPEIVQDLIGLAFRLSEVVGVRPLPYLEDLTIFHLTESPQEITQTLVRPFMNQLRALSLTSWTWTGDDATIFPNLVELQLMIIATNADLEKLLKIEAPGLEKLTITFNFRKVNVKILNKVLTHFPNLRVLGLKWSGLVNIKQPYLDKTGPPAPHLQIPNLHTLKMCNSPDVNYSFLRWFPNLEHLFLAQWVPTDAPLVGPIPSKRIMKKVSTREVVQMHKYLYTGNLRHSNIWDIFPRLKIVSVQRIRQPTPENQRLTPWLRLQCIVQAWDRSRFPVVAPVANIEEGQEEN